MSETKTKKRAPLLGTIENLDLTRVAIFTGAGVDPDGLACGMVMNAIVEKFGGKADIFYRGTFNRPQNKTAREILGLNVNSFSKQDWKNHHYTAIISVDGPGEVWIRGAQDLLE